MYWKHTVGQTVRAGDERQAHSWHIKQSPSMSTALKKSGDSKPLPSLPFGLKGLRPYLLPIFCLQAVPGREPTGPGDSSTLCRFQAVFSLPLTLFSRGRGFCLSYPKFVWTHLPAIVLLCPSVTAATCSLEKFNRLLGLAQPVLGVPGLHILRHSQPQLKNIQKNNSTYVEHV